MKKILLFLLLFTSVAYSKDMSMSMSMHESGVRSYSDIFGSSGLTFYKDYEYATSVDADYSIGSPIGTFTASRSASNPATYIDESGVIQTTTTSNAPRFTKGYYDTTGFNLQRGILIEGAGTNLFVNGKFDSNSTWNDGVSGDQIKYSGTQRWSLYVNTGGSTATTVNTISTDTCYSGGRSAKISITDGGSSISDIQFTNSNSFSITNTIKYAVSFWVKCNSVKSIVLSLQKNDAPYTDYSSEGAQNFSTVANTWIRVVKTFTANTDAADARINISLGNIGTFDIQFESFQIEANPYATSFIPTTTEALTRNAEVLKYFILNNRTAEQESIFIKYYLISVLSNDGIDRYLTDTDTKQRYIRKTTTGTNWGNARPNATDSSGCGLNLDSPSINTTAITSFIMKHSSPYATGYLDGVEDSSPETSDDYINPDWGTYFYIGCNKDENNYINGVIQSIAFFNRALTPNEVSNVTTIFR